MVVKGLNIININFIFIIFNCIILEPCRKLPIHVATSSGHADVVKILIEAGSRLDDVDKFGRSPLMWATKGRYVEVVKVLLQAGTSVTSQGNSHALRVYLVIVWKSVFSTCFSMYIPKCTKHFSTVKVQPPSVSLKLIKILLNTL